MEIGVGIYGLCTPLLFQIIEKVYLASYQLGRENLLLFTLFQFILVFIILVVPTTLMGGTLPILSRYFVRKETEIGYGVGAIYALNTAGAVVGTIAAGFFFLPVMGVSDTIWIAATITSQAIGTAAKKPRAALHALLRRTVDDPVGWGTTRYVTTVPTIRTTDA
jgi:spermidine synthase